MNQKKVKQINLNFYFPGICDITQLLLRRTLVLSALYCAKEKHYSKRVRRNNDDMKNKCRENKKNCLL